MVFQHQTATDFVFTMYNTNDGVTWWTWPLHLTVTILGLWILNS